MPTEPTSPDPSPTTWERLDRLLPDHTWDWPGWLPRGFLTILASEPGAGKSLLCLRLAATYLDGRPWPDGTRPDSGALEARSLPGAPRRILWCETEAGHDLNLNRARHWGLDLSRIISPLSSPLHNFKIDNNDHGLAFFRLSCDRTVRLVVLDSLRGLHSRPGSAVAIQAILSLSDLARIARKPFWNDTEKVDTELRWSQ